jgi:hypothetical protein
VFILRSNLRVAIRWSEATSLSDFRGAVGEDVISLNGVPSFIAIQVCHNSQFNAAERVLFHENLGTHSRVDTRCWDLFVARAVDVGGTKAERWCPRIDVVPIIVVVSNMELSGILALIAV